MNHSLKDFHYFSLLLKCLPYVLNRVRVRQRKSERERKTERERGIRYVSGSERDSTSKARLLIASFFRSWERTRDRENGERERK